MASNRQLRFPFVASLLGSNGYHEHTIYCQSLAHVERLQDIWTNYTTDDGERKRRFLCEWKVTGFPEDTLYRVLMYKRLTRDKQEKVLHRRYYTQVQSTAWHLAQMWEMYSKGTALIVKPGSTVPSRSWKKYQQPF